MWSVYINTLFPVYVIKNIKGWSYNWRSRGQKTLSVIVWSTTNKWKIQLHLTFSWSRNSVRYCMMYSRKERNKCIDLIIITNDYRATHRNSYTKLSQKPHIVLVTTILWTIILVISISDNCFNNTDQRLGY